MRLLALDTLNTKYPNE